MMEQTHKKLNAIFALMVGAIACATYLAIVAPTVSFWDCGEYAASCHTLEIPHPPGNPLYIMMGRTVSMSLFFLQDKAYRLNLITVVMDAISALLIYLIVVRTLIGFMGIPDTLWKRITVYTGGIVGGLFAAFGATFLFCSVEAEVNGPQLLPIVLNTWLALVWAQSHDPKRDRLLLLITYISFLGIGIHMYSMIVMIPIFLFIMLSDKQKTSDWRLWVTTPLVGLVMYDAMLFLYLAPATALVTLVLSLVNSRNRQKWRLCFWVAFLAFVGFSCHLYIPVRSNLNPMIDENHPATAKAFSDYMQRKQYGSETMVERMFWRRGTWSHQFGIEGNMGFGGFMATQFFHVSPNDTKESWFGKGPLPGTGKFVLYLLPVGLMFFGWYYIYRKHRNTAILLISLELISTVGLVVYMNFADGTRSEKREYVAWVNHGRMGPEPIVHREVRVRDYFWVGGFLFYGMWMGLAAGGLLHGLFTNKRKILRTTIAPVVSVLFLVSPVLPFSQNVRNQSRHGNFVPFDYAYNLLMTCEMEGVLFTNGDNDTFPLWALQEAYGIRRDVRIVNLSLANTDWYIKQLKDLDPKVPISFTREQIDGLIHELNPFAVATAYTLPNAGITVMIPGRQQQNALKLQDKLVLNIVDSNKWRKPIYFAVTVSDDNFMGLGPYLQMQGLAYRVMPGVVSQDKKIDIDRTVDLLERVYKFRGLGDGTANLDETTKRLLSNYAACYIQVALTLRSSVIDLRDQVESLKKQQAGTSKIVQPEQSVLLESKQKEYDRVLGAVIGTMDQCIALMPQDWRPRMLRQEFLVNHSRFAEAESRAREALAIDPENLEYLKMLAQALELEGKPQAARDVLKKTPSRPTGP
jgi:hypothetical protein